MTEVSYFKSATSYSQAEYAAVFKTIHLDGVDASIANYLKVYFNVAGGMNVLVPTGEAWIQGYKYTNGAVVTATIGAADATHSRLDTIVLRLTHATGVIAVAVLAGVADGNDAATALTQNGTTWEIPLAYCMIEAASSSVPANKITDGRLNLVGSSFSLTIDEGGAAITTGKKYQTKMSGSYRVLGWTLVADVAGAIVIDVNKSTYAGFPTTATMSATEKPTIAATNQKAQNLALADWSDIVEGDILEFEVDSCTTITRVTLTLDLVRKS